MFRSQVIAAQSESWSDECNGDEDDDGETVDNGGDGSVSMTL